MSDDTGWSAEADASTRRALSDMPFGSRGRELHCKHAGGEFGIAQTTGLAGDIEVMQKSGVAATFRSIDDFIRAGWTID